MLREAGAAEVHMRIVSPEVKWPCFYGIDTDAQRQLISANKDVAGVCEWIDADSLGFLSLPGLLSCVKPGGYCCACFDGSYPVAIPAALSRDNFLDGYAPNNLRPSSATSHRLVREIALEIEKEYQE